MKEEPQLPTEKFTATMKVSNVPIDTKNRIDSIADKKGITTTALVKNIMNDFLDKQPK